MFSFVNDVNLYASGMISALSYLVLLGGMSSVEVRCLPLPLIAPRSGNKPWAGASPTAGFLVNPRQTRSY